MKKIIAFAGSSSKNSINKKLVTYATSFFENVDVEILDLNDYEMPIYSIDKEKENGFPDLAFQFLSKLESADLLVVSMAEHNGNYTTAFKNILDWTSRINPKTFLGKKMLLMATSPGGRGGSSVLEIAKDRFPRHDAEIVGTFSLPSFNESFDVEKGVITDMELKNELMEIINSIEF
ncbi:NADPH-dependent FMN reductase [Flavobacterium capsici]|uniref:NAD(P)H-dependent oxidoreductase n=1 Tax=Flavobacterium capsici TaxID=3075618 RepID=A0AA96F5J0_9FLAO|nr:MULTISPECIES: NAD(P)H-dependent oxidoreductase [unclassified Flavobacterium]WNM20433.1 NAD(P)H-dependent oxidoreductase [Flavobacterium sp. PMR2A8]WNM23140.1 NAD(P)H-dependent oxidoreductase [Flavobacterium sp. PMTSA4]